MRDRVAPAGSDSSRCPEDQNGRPPAARIEPVNLWVMSRPVPVSHGLPGLKRAGRDQPPVPAITVRLTSPRQLRPG